MSTVIKELNHETVPRGRGRPRDEEARARILEATLEVLEHTCFPNATVDAIAERAGVSKATIYRWWPTKAAVFIEALREATAQEMPFPETGNLAEDIHAQLQNFVKLLTGPRGRTFKAFIAGAQSDPEVAEAFRQLWIKPRRAQALAILQRYQEAGEIATEIDLETGLDLLYGPFYFRLLAGHAPLTAAFARKTAALALQGLCPPLRP